jgi:hypothetical protein
LCRFIAVFLHNVKGRDGRQYAVDLMAQQPLALYAGVIVKVPFPPQPAVAPATVQVPVICPFFTAPFRFSVLTSAPVLVTVYWKFPDT